MRRYRELERHRNAHAHKLAIDPTLIARTRHAGGSGAGLGQTRTGVDGLAARIVEMIKIMNLATAFAASAQKQPDKIALYWGDSEFTYAALLAQSGAVAAALTGKFGVKPGDRVGLWLKNRPEFIPAVFGVLGADAVLVPINNFLKPDEVNYILHDAGIDVVITDEELPSTPLPCSRRGRNSKFSGLRISPRLNPSATRHPPSSRSKKDLAVIIYTSGTTGRPKGAMLSHGNLLHNVESCASCWRRRRRTGWRCCCRCFTVTC